MMNIIDKEDDRENTILWLIAKEKVVIEDREIAETFYVVFISPFYRNGQMWTLG